MGYSGPVISLPPLTLKLRWNEKAGLPAGCGKLPMDTHSKCKEETGL